MQLNKDPNQGAYVIRSYADGKLKINAQTYTQSVVLTLAELISDWQPQCLAEITEEHISSLCEYKPEVVLLGTGVSLIFPDQAILAPFYNHNIGVEIMDTAAACRTYNVLTAEDRKVLAILLIN